MKSFTSNTAKTIGMGLTFIAISPLAPVIALMHVMAWLCDEPQEYPTSKLPIQNESGFRPVPNLELAV